MHYWRATICVSLFLAMSLFALSRPAEAAVSASSIQLEDLAGELSSPEKIARYIWRHFLFENDQRNFGKSEHWQTPDELLQNGKGDCEDFAFFAKEILRANGIQAFLVNIYGKRYAHTVCVFKENGKYHVIDGEQVKRYEANDLSEIFSKIYPHWNKAAIVAYSSITRSARALKFFEK